MSDANASDAQSSDARASAAQSSEPTSYDAKRAIVLLSGGMDSCVVATMLAADGFELNALHTNYGQRTERKELECFHAIADHLKVARRMVVDIGHLAAIGGSSLTDRRIEVTRADLESRDVPSSYVPFRNANIMAIAVSWAEVIGAGAVAIGAVEEDASGYPDCREVFYEAFQRVVNLGTRPETEIEILTPVIRLSKEEIVREGTRLGARLDLTWSCYTSETVACGTCDSCALRRRGFERAHIPDPIPHAGA